MANSKNTGLIILSVVIVAVLIGFGTGAITPQSLNVGSNAGGGGMQTPTPTPTPTGGSEFAGQLIVNVIHRDALDNAETRTEGTNLVTTYYKSFDGQNFFTIGSGSGNQITIDKAQNSVLYASETVPIGQAYFVAPTSTSDQNLNPRITEFGFRDLNADGTKEWWFKFNLKNMDAPIAGQTASTLSFFVNSYDDGSSTLNSPADISGVGTATGVQNYIRWEDTVGQETADPVYEVQLDMNTTATERWDRGQSNIDIPNIGVKSLADFDENIQSSTTQYRYKIGASASLDNADYITTAQNGNAVHQIPFRFVTNYVSGTSVIVTLTIKSMTPAQGTVSVSDSVTVSA